MLGQYQWQSKKPHDLITSMQYIFDKIGVPKQLYSDQEGSFNTAEFIRLLNKHKVNHIVVVDKAHTVERFNRTLKEHIQPVLYAMALRRDKWTSQLEAVVSKYTNTVHITISMSPNDALKDGSKLTAAFNIWAHSKEDRAYPELKVGDEVRVLLTKGSKTKGYFPKWSND